MYENLIISEKKAEESNRDYVYRVLRNNIMTLKLEPGSPLREHDLADLLHISRTPVHEGIALLKTQYLADIFPKSGSRVSLVNLNIVREGYFLRSMIEAPIIRQLAGNLSPEYEEKLYANLLQQREALKLPDCTDDYFCLDNMFHQLTYEAANKPHIWNSVQMTVTHFDRVRYMCSILMGDDLSRYYDEHFQMYTDYLIGGGSSFYDAENYVSTHLSHFKQFIPKLVRTYPDYFSF